MKLFSKRLFTTTMSIAAVSFTLAAQQSFAAASTGLERQTEAFLDALAAGGGKPLETLSPADARQVLIGAQKGAKLPAADVSEKIIQIDGKPLTLKIVRPQGAKGVLPAFMFFHGGGWVLGDFQTHERLIRDLVVKSGAAAIYVDYTPSPEAHYPTAINQAYAATAWVAQNGSSIKVDGSRLAVAGNSVGGNMAAVVALKAKEAGSPKLSFQLLLWPVTDASFNNASYNQFAKDHFLTRNMMHWFWDNYTTNPAERNEIYASPLRASEAQLRNLPDALIQTAEFDVLRDEGEAYAAKLDRAGVNVTSVRYQGMIHDFGLLNALSQVPATRSAMDQAGAALKAHLE